MILLRGGEAVVLRSDSSRARFAVLSAGVIRIDEAAVPFATPSFVKGF